MMDHEQVIGAFLSSGADKRGLAEVTQEYSGNRASITLRGVPEGDDFPLQRGGKQGGPLTPKDWNIMLDNAFAPMVQSWAGRGIGPTFGGTGVSHAIWADNIVLFS